ncbi:MAG TPA: hypothetical protein VFA38_01825 [Nitrospirales bacterium]|nr:hypothetical protein [Nitrospirales bacterium]
MNVRTFLMIPALLFALTGPMGCLFPVHDDYGHDDGHHAAGHDDHYYDRDMHSMHDDHYYDSHYDRDYDHHDVHHY